MINYKLIEYEISESFDHEINSYYSSIANRYKNNLVDLFNCLSIIPPQKLYLIRLKMNSYRGVINNHGN